MKEKYTNRLGQYARLLLKSGLNIQPGQPLMVVALTETAEFTELLTEEAYRCGAGIVEILYYSEEVQKCTTIHGDPERFSSFWNHVSGFIDRYLDNGGAIASLISSDPFLLKDVDPKRVGKAGMDKMNAMAAYMKAAVSRQVRAAGILVPTRGWAERLFPGSPSPLDDMWNTVLTCCYADEGDAVDRWERHMGVLKSRKESLDNLSLRELHFTSPGGTDISVGLTDDPLWNIAEGTDPRGIPYCINIPTEEVFTSPHRERMNGVVKSSKPLVYYGSVIDDFSLELKDGRIVDFHAATGHDALKSIIEIDEGTRFLGEIALVPFSNPINASGLVFNTTLFDENAACHLAIGAGIPSATAGADKSEEALRAQGVNRSKAHVDFMFGTKDTRCTGRTAGGKDVLLMENGEIVI